MTVAFERTIAHDGSVELEIRKSRFIGTAFRAADEDTARAIIDRVRKENWNANHNCTAWRIGPNGRSQRTSDDGEPAGTAGVPMLDVLNHREITDTLVIVTRYFGGVKLGAGGLIRAYGSAVSSVINHVGIVERRELTEVTVAIGHADSGRFENYLRSTEFVISDTRYTNDGVEFVVFMEPSELPGYATMVSAQTSGRYEAVATGSKTVEVPVVEE